MRFKKNLSLFLLILALLSTILLNKLFRPQDVLAVLQGDINNDGRVDVLDFQILSNSFGKSQGQSGFNPNADLNTDTRVDVLDFQILSNNFGRTGTTTPTPTAPIPTSPPGNNMTDCSGYQNPRRVFLETQAWWMSTASINGPVPPGQTPVRGIGGHAHTATCFPQDQQIPNGTHRFNVRLMLHKGQVGAVRLLDIGVGPDGRSLARRTFDPPITCAGGSNLSTMCEMWIPIDLVVDDRIPPGYSELRFRFIIRQPNGEEQFASTAWMGYFHGSTNVHNRQPPFLQARGWYTGAEYENATFRSPFPYNTLSGTWTFRAAMHPGSGGIPVARHSVHVNARFNADDFGTIINEGSGSFDGNVNLDTTRFPNGTHCVAIRTDSVDKNGGTDTGILQFPIRINNPGKPSGNGRGGCAPGT